MSTARIRTLVVSEVARWSCWRAPRDASAPEVEAVQARRSDYARSIVDAVAVEADRDRFMSALGRALNRAAETPWGQEPPSPGMVLKWVRDELGDTDQSAPPKPGALGSCSRCQREHGITLYGVHYGPQPAVIDPRHRIATEGAPARQATAEPLCGWHVELGAWESSDRHDAEAYPAPAWTRGAVSMGR